MAVKKRKHTLAAVASALIIAVIVIIACGETGGRSYVEYDNLSTVVSVSRNGQNRATENSTSDRLDIRQRRLPQCIIIGAAKCGTRALLSYLDLHPNVVTATPELSYFSDNHIYDRGLEWYRSQMPTSRQNQITMEKSPSYFYESCVVPARIYAMNAATKIILVVRDPVDRAVSNWIQNCRKYNQTPVEMCRTFEESDILTASGHINPNCSKLRHSVYAENVDNWIKLFPLRTQFHVVNGEKLVSDPVSELKKVETFLGLRHHITEKNIIVGHKVGFYCLVSEQGKKQCLGPSKGVKHPELMPEVEAKLRAYFKPLNQRFYRDVGQDFGWP